MQCNLYIQMKLEELYVSELQSQGGDEAMAVSKQFSDQNQN